MQAQGQHETLVFVNKDCKHNIKECANNGRK